MTPQIEDLWNFTSLYALIFSGLVLYVLASWSLRHARSSHRLPYPPGPKPRNFITGNMGDFPKAYKPYLEYMKMGKQYGSDLIHMEALGHHYVVINSFKAANELLEKRASINSSRPFTLMDKLGGWENVLGLLPYADQWRIFRKLFHQNFRPNGAVKFRHIQLEKVHMFLRDLLGPYDEFMDCVVTLSESVAFSAMYGYDITSHKEHLPRSGRQAVGVVELGMLPGHDAFNYTPFIRYLPSWFPGCGFKKLARDCRACIEEIKEVPFKIAMDFWKENRWSLLGELVHSDWGDEQNLTSKKVDVMKMMGATTILASSDTTSAAIGTFILCMALNPHVQHKAQEEIDQILGNDRLPNFEDRPSLPYIEAIYREVLRWCPIIPLCESSLCFKLIHRQLTLIPGLPHYSTEDDVYNGYYIPKGTTLYPNIWAMTRDEQVYEKPEEFIPERHIKPDGGFEGINSILAYGFGRRVCVGRHVADAQVWLTIACLLSVFNITKAKGPDGKEIEINVDDSYHFGGFVFPKSFPCAISPRSDAAEKMIRETSKLEYDKLYPS
ncbi:hypothetical protein D9758_007624 [Tetrapyrgos nigripes]|uniref:Cytochrome P450 n=1 Tax=Tetrapyrgos nigripes TaxID=182062 RepID=A0A8H5G7Z5_9AGAR|nr:hypothetical protein D9758_007624 [Tetrapyrgos nigripes]